MKPLVLTVLALLSWNALATISGGKKAPAAVPEEALKGEAGDLVTRVSDDGKRFEIQNENHKFVPVEIRQVSDDVTRISTADGQTGQLIAASDESSTQCQNGCVYLAYYGGPHHRFGWGHLGWRGRYWYPHRDYWRRGWEWHYHHWHPGFWRHP